MRTKWTSAAFGISYLLGTLVWVNCGSIEHEPEVIPLESYHIGKSDIPSLYKNTGISLSCGDSYTGEFRGEDFAHAYDFECTAGTKGEIKINGTHAAKLGTIIAIYNKINGARVYFKNAKTENHARMEFSCSTNTQLAVGVRTYIKKASNQSSYTLSISCSNSSGNGPGGICFDLGGGCVDKRSGCGLSGYPVDGVAGCLAFETCCLDKHVFMAAKFSDWDKTLWLEMENVRSEKIYFSGCFEFQRLENDQWKWVSQEGSCPTVKPLNILDPDHTYNSNKMRPTLPKGAYYRAVTDLGLGCDPQKELSKANCKTVFSLESFPFFIGEPIL